MSEFIKRLQDRLKAKNLGKGQTNLEQSGSINSSDPVRPSRGPFLTLPTFGISLFSNFVFMGSNKRISSTPRALAKILTYILMLACAFSVTYWLMRIIQIPSTPSSPANGINKGLTLYVNQDANAAYGLFGTKPMVTENIYLRGVVVTSKNSNGTLDGFAIFEIDGRPTNAISVGESIGKELSLYSIGDEQATLLYQGQKLNFKLSKPSKDKTNKTSNAGSNTLNKQ